ncbi:ankyrin repeat domain-containing protein [uncultured Nocardioides sp.]|uniref:ankyrin repeat domain-containing protein n=1 Tax=uncultured Nocardioides sp. TaxID=198441 RepID=UPI002623C63C|nr:ankyrin repeat domain-containing protein [uncultured Nocardioides sp.]
MSHGDYKAFFAATCAGYVELVRHHLDAGVDVDFVHPELQSTALVAALEEGREDVALLLLDHGASPTLLSPLEGATPLQAARAAGLDRVAARLSRASPAT